MGRIEARFDEDYVVILLDGEPVWDVLDVWDGPTALVELNALEDLDGIQAGEVPEQVVFQLHHQAGLGTYMFHELHLHRDDGVPVADFIHHHPNKYWEGRYGLATLLAAMIEQVAFEDGVEVAESELEDDWKRLVLRFQLPPDGTLPETVATCVGRANDIIRNAENALAGLRWVEEYEKNERRFCLEVLAPLLRRMGFSSVRYVQGNREYGRDFTFSEPTRFGDLRHFGLQAKAGDVRGNVKGDVDELLGQVDDAFKMPYNDVSSGEQRYISVFIIAISGKYTDQAKEKVIHKLPRGLVGSVYFLDRERILELAEKYWRA